MADRPKLSIADLDDRLETFLMNRLSVKHDPETGRHRAAIEAELHRLDGELVGWFAERGIDLVIDRDTVSHERLA